MGWRRRVIIIAVAIAVVLAVVWGFVPAPVPVETARVTHGPMRVTVDDDGETRVVDRFVISAPVAGYASRIEFDPGAKVKGGDVIAVLEPLRPRVLDPRSRAEAEARVAAAKAELKVAGERVRAAEVEAGFAETERERVKKLFDGGYAPLDRMERADADASRKKAELMSARFSVEVAKFDLEAARTALKYSVEAPVSEKISIRTPVAGEVLKVIHESEGPVAEGAPLMEVGDPRSLEVIVDVLSNDAVRIKPGSAVEFTRWGGEGALEGRVTRVEPSGFTKVSALGVEEQRVNVISVITSPPETWSRLGDGYSVDASFVVWQGTDVLRVPANALFRQSNGWAAFVVENGRARKRDVKVGHMSGLEAEVISGLKENDIVITHPDESIEDATRVRAR